MSKTCFFVSDLHGRVERYAALFAAIAEERPRAVFFGGDLLPGSAGSALLGVEDFVTGFLVHNLNDLRPVSDFTAFLIPGNDDSRSAEASFRSGADSGVWHYLVDGPAELDGRPVHGYPWVPPTPFGLKDWERFDVSRYVDPGCVAPEEGHFSVEPDLEAVRHRTIAADLDGLEGDLGASILMFHSPPYKTALDRAALDGVQFEHVPVDVHVGSIAVQRFITDRQPLLTLHGHVHESARLTGAWRCRIGRTHCLSAAHDGPELALVRFDPEDLDGATRELIG